jgi:predicted N-acetyltransferase YhbS
MPTIEIKNFVDCPESLPEVAARIHAQWFADKAGHTEEGMLARMRKGKRAEVPIGLAAFVDGALAGTVSLVESDLEERKDLTPWLAGLLVFPEFRGLGVGTALVWELVRSARQAGCARFYLYTDKPEFYERLGWQKHSEVRSDPGCWVMDYEMRVE